MVKGIELTAAGNGVIIQLGDEKYAKMFVRLWECGILKQEVMDSIYAVMRAEELLEPRKSERR